jgi:hypothetical protein
MPPASSVNPVKEDTSADCGVKSAKPKIVNSSTSWTFPVFHPEVGEAGGDLKTRMAGIGPGVLGRNSYRTDPARAGEAQRDQARATEAIEIGRILMGYLIDRRVVGRRPGAAAPLSWRGD